LVEETTFNPVLVISQLQIDIEGASWIPKMLVTFRPATCDDIVTIKDEKELNENDLDHLKDIALATCVKVCKGSDSCRCRSNFST
jgi:hypothetical protein